MPFVLVNRGHRNFIPEEVFRKVIESLPEIVADALTCENPEGKLEPKHVAVWVRESNKYDIGSDKLQILVFANTYPERKVNLDDRQNAITDRIDEIVHLLPGQNFPIIHGCVYIRLADSSFGEF